jgi:myo-inositol-1(or 4)-monophosphatase
MRQLLHLAIGAAELAGDLLLDGQRGARQVDAKSSPTDVVTQMDTAAEQAILDHLLTARPDDAVLGEEAGGREGTSGVRWIIDPLDGTVNYLYGLPLWAVSVAAEVEGSTAVGAVAVPALGAMYWAVQGQGAHVREGGGVRTLAVRPCEELAAALVATGFGYRAQRRAAQGAALAKVLPQVRDVRRAGAAALDLCWVASGLVDAYFERGVQPWDMAAGNLLVREAGGIVTGAEQDDPDDRLVVAAGPGIHAELRRTLLAAGAHTGD